MLRYITICSETRSTKKYIRLIDKLMMKSDVYYEIYSLYGDNKSFNQLKKTDYGTTIFIIENNSDVIAEHIVKKIRDVYKMVNAFIIIIDKGNNKKLQAFVNNYKFLIDVIGNGEDVELKLKQDLKTILEISNNKQVLSIIYDKLLYRIPFKDIYYIEKELNGKRSKIVSKGGSFYVVRSLNEIQKELNERFYRSHQSAIINIDNVRKIDFENNMIIFENDVWCELISRNFKRQLRSTFTKSN